MSNATALALPTVPPTTEEEHDLLALADAIGVLVASEGGR